MLTGKQRRHLRSLGHHLEPVVHIGKEGLTEGLYAAATEALLTHELIKLRVGEAAPGERHELAAELARHTQAELVQVLGRTALLYRRRPDDDPRPHIALS